jgi:DNA helicase HerA-like ATPase
MRANPKLNVEAAITELAVGEALVSFLDEKGRPTVTERVYVHPPGSQIGPITAAQRQSLIAGSLVAGQYDKTIDRESAYELLKGRAAQSGEIAEKARDAAAQPGGDAEGGLMGSLGGLLFGSTGPRGGRRQGIAEAAAKSAMRSVGSAVGREIVRGVLGGLLGGTTRRRR